MERINTRFIDDRAEPVYSDVFTNGDVCDNCVIGACCNVEGPIYLSSLDIIRYCAAFNMTPRDFMLEYTQDKFVGDGFSHYEENLLDPNTSDVTYLRRKSQFGTSPCIFQHYVADNKGRPVSRCLSHHARSITCREFNYTEGCRHKVSNEVGTMVAALIEAVKNDNLNLINLCEYYSWLMNDNNMKFIEAYESVTKATKIITDGGTESIWGVKDSLLLCVVGLTIEALTCNDDRKLVVSNFDITKYQHPIEQKLERMFNKSLIKIQADINDIKCNDIIDAINDGRQYLKYEDTDISNPIHHEMLYINAGIRYICKDGNWPINKKIKFINSDYIKHIVERLDLVGLDENVIYTLTRVYNNLLSIVTWLVKTGYRLENTELLMHQELCTLFVNCLTSPFMKKYFKDSITSAVTFLYDDILKTYPNINDLIGALDDTDTLSCVAIYENLKVLNKDTSHIESLIESNIKLSKKKLINDFSISNVIIVVSKCNKEDADEDDYEKLYDLVCCARWYLPYGITTEQQIYEMYLYIMNNWKPVLTPSNIIDVYNTITHIGYGINLYARKSNEELFELNPGYKEIYTWINDFVWKKLYPYMKEYNLHDTDPETISEFLDATHTNLGFSTNDENYREVLSIILNRIELNGSVNSNKYDSSQRYYYDGVDLVNLPQDQDEYIYSIYHSAWTVLDGLRSYMDSII